MTLEDRLKTRRNQKTSWKQKATRVVGAIALPFIFASQINSAKIAKANLPIEPVKTLEADLNKDGIVNFKDLIIMTNQWLEKDPNIIPVYECGCLNEPNAVYVLQNDITQEDSEACIRVSAPNIELNGNGHSIKCQMFQHNLIGVYSDQPNTTIRNCNIDMGGTIYGHKGIVLQVSTNSHLLNNLLNSCYYGIYLDDSSNNILTGNIIDGNDYKGEYGIYLKDSLNNILIGNVVVYNDLQGIHLESSSNNILTGNNVNYNFYRGISLLSSSSGNIFKDNDFSSNICYDVDIGWFGGGNNNNIFLNCIYSSAKEAVDSDSSLIRQWTYRAISQDARGNPVFNTLVSANNREGGLEFMVRTGADGNTPQMWLTEYENKGGIKTVFSPYTITATKDNRSASHVYDPNGFNSEDKFVLE